MPERHHNIFLHGLSLAMRCFPALLWTYFFNLALAFLFSIGLNLQLAKLLDHSLAAQRLSSGFDLGTLSETYLHLHEGPVGGAGISFGHTSIPFYLLIYFLLVPGTLFYYQTETSAHLSTLLRQGLLYFWSFVRITLLTVLICAVILVPLSFLQDKWADHIDEQSVGRPAFLAILAGNIVLFLVASVLRLYFDLVEVYAVQLGLHLLPAEPGKPAKPARRILRSLAPAWRTLRNHFSQVWPIFLFLTLLGFAAVILTARTSMHMLAKPRVWPTFLLAQLGLFLMLFTRFWQRGVETSLALQNPMPPHRLLPPILPDPDTLDPHRRIQLSPESSITPAVNEPISNPEP